MQQTRVRRFARLSALMLLSSAGAEAQEGYGTVRFTVHLTGLHYVPTSEGGHRKIEKNRTFTGTARMKYAGASFAPPPTPGYDRTSFEREKDACERRLSDEEQIATCQDEVQTRQNAAERDSLGRNNPVTAALQGVRTQVWATESCTGELVVADRGTYRGIDINVGRMIEVPYLLSARHSVASDAPGGDGCAFNLVFNPQAQTAHINLDTGPLRLDVVESVANRPVKTNINPFDWSAVRKLEKANIRVSVAEGGHSGAWNESTGEPLALTDTPRVDGEVVQTSTRIAWHFTGSPPKTGPRASVRDNGPVTPSGDAGPIENCLQEQKDAGREQPDPVELMQCVERKSRSQ